MVVYLALPERPARSRVERDEPRVERGEKERITENRDAAIVRAAARLMIRRGVVLIDPVHASGFGVERHDVVRTLRDVHHAVDDERRRLPWAHNRALIDPLELERARIRRRDLRQLAEALTEVRAGVGEPVLR